MSTNANTNAQNNSKTVKSADDGKRRDFKLLAIIFGIATAILISMVVVEAVLLSRKNNDAPSKPAIDTRKPWEGQNICQDKDVGLQPVQCVIDGILQTGEQSAVNVTKGYNGGFETNALPITVPFYQIGMCAVNVHWHLGAEHLSVGEYDETGSGPSDVNEHRNLAEGARQGYQCKLYNETDPMFTTPFDWQHCDKSMEVGQTYEVHWPHSAAGACGTPNQYQTPFADGVFCRDGIINATNTASHVGVQAQVFTIVNDEAYYYPDLMRGMIVEGDAFGYDLAMYTGSTTGDKYNNNICSQYTPISWHVDRKCHLISASSFDKMCGDMKAQRDDMSVDLIAHGSRELVAYKLAANNHANRRLRRQT